MPSCVCCGMSRAGAGDGTSPGARTLLRRQGLDRTAATWKQPTCVMCAHHSRLKTPQEDDWFHRIFPCPRQLEKCWLIWVLTNSLKTQLTRAKGGKSWMKMCPMGLTYLEPSLYLNYIRGSLTPTHTPTHPLLMEHTWGPIIFFWVSQFHFLQVFEIIVPKQWGRL